MAGKDITLYEESSSTHLYPRTYTRNVFDEDGTTTLQTLLANIVNEAGKIAEVKVNGVALTITNKSVNVTVPTINVGGSSSSNATDLVSLGYGKYIWKNGTYIKIVNTTYSNSSGDIPMEFNKVGSSYVILAQYSFSVNFKTALTENKFKSSSGAFESASPIVPGFINGGNSPTNIYAPTTGGTSGQFLKSNGNNAPTWETITIPDVSGFYPKSGGKLNEGAVIILDGSNPYVGLKQSNGTQYYLQGHEGELGMSIGGSWTTKRLSINGDGKVTVTSGNMKLGGANITYDSTNKCVKFTFD